MENKYVDIACALQLINNHQDFNSEQQCSYTRMIFDLAYAEKTKLHTDVKMGYTDIVSALQIINNNQAFSSEQQYSYTRMIFDLVNAEKTELHTNVKKSNTTGQNNYKLMNQCLAELLEKVKKI